ncbi:site-specific integrase [Nibrella saemangeumensis]|uniref:Site-specific integrase n=1 Tax=Nibrella saemangeumensis TaxID=1084526 RepID=A0ABP8MZL6_9BACT
MASVRLILYTHKTLRNGEHPILLSFIKDRKRKTISTGLSCKAELWDDATNLPNRRHPNRKELSGLLTQKLTEAHRQLIEFEGKENYQVKQITRKQPESEAKREVYVLTYLKEVRDELVRGNRIGNANIYRDLRNQLISFTNDKNFPFESVDVAFCNRFETYLRAKQCRETSISVYFRTLRAAFNKAISEGLVKVDAYPFSRNRSETHKFSVSRFDTSTQKRAVSREDIRKIEEYAAGTKRVQLAKDVFLFSFYVGGINFVDLAQLRWRNILTDENGNQRLLYIRQKTKGKFNIKLLPPAIAILSSYGKESGQDDDYIFPILHRNRHVTPMQIENRLCKLNRQINNDLKEIGRKKKINLPLTTYVARHSFATTLKKSGTPIAVISQLMGHDSEQTTRIYLDSFENEVLDDAVNALL